jgi:hypothetical protein
VKPVVALDLDDLIYPFIDHVIPFLNESLGLDSRKDDYHTYDFEVVLGTDRQTIVDLMPVFADRFANPHPQPLEGSLEAVVRMSENYRLAIVTSRPDEMHRRTIEWLDHHFSGVFEGVHLCNSYVIDGRASVRCKSDVCLEIGAIALVDDSLGNVTKAASKGVKGILFGDFPWNRADELPDGVTRVHDWEQVMDELEQLR